MDECQEIKACRLCLVMDCNLSSIDAQLEDSMKNIFGQNISYESGLPKYACSMCAKFLGKYRTFRDKCLKAQTILNNMLKNSNKITDTEIRQLNRKRLKLDVPLSPESTSTREEAASPLQVEIPCVSIKLEPMEVEMEDENQFEEGDEVLLNTSNPLELKTEKQRPRRARKEIKQEITLAPEEVDISEGYTMSIPAMKWETSAKRPRMELNEDPTSEPECGPYDDDDGECGSDYSRDSDDLSSSDEELSDDDTSYSSNVKDNTQQAMKILLETTVSGHPKFVDASFEPTNEVENENIDGYSSEAHGVTHSDQIMYSNIDYSRSDNQQLIKMSNTSLETKNYVPYEECTKKVTIGNPSNFAGDIVTKNVLNNNQASLNERPGPSSAGDIEWDASFDTIPNFAFDVYSRGLRARINEDATPLDIFKLVFSEQLLDFVLRSTNAYGEALVKSNMPHARHSRFKSFRAVSKEEMLAFLGLCLLQSQVKGPKGRAMFSFSDPLYYHPVYTYVMSGRRFEQILRCISFSEHNAKGEKKVKDFNTALCEHFRQILGPDKELFVDEPLILFRGRLASRQFIEAKKARYGIQFYELTSADGYVLNIKMCPGKDNSQEIESFKTENTEDIVMTLLKPYLMKGHHVFLDKYYTDVELSQKLLNLQTHTNGALRKTRKTNPKVLMTKKLKKGDYFWSRKKQVYVTAWKDKRPVYFLTTRNLPKFKKITDRYGNVTEKPEEIAEYNSFTGKIDRNEQMVTYYSSPLKTLPWFKNAFFHLLDIVVWNAYYLYRRFMKKRVRYEFLDFRDQLIKEMTNVGKDIKGLDTVRTGSIFSNRRFAGGPAEPKALGHDYHWPEEIPKGENSKRNAKYMNCNLCIKKKKRKATKFRCKGCPRKTQLCPQCFEEWHMNYLAEN